MFAASIVLVIDNEVNQRVFVTIQSHNNTHIAKKNNYTCLLYNITLLKALRQIAAPERRRFILVKSRVYANV